MTFNILINSNPYSHLVRTIIGHSDWVRCIEPSDDGKMIASCSNDQVSACMRGVLCHPLTRKVDSPDHRSAEWRN